MKTTLREWAPTLAVLLTGAALIAAQARSQGQLEAQAVATNSSILVLKEMVNIRLNGVEARVSRLEDWAHTPGIERPAMPRPYDILLPGVAYADTTKPVKVPRPRTRNGG